MEKILKLLLPKYFSRLNSGRSEINLSQQVSINEAIWVGNMEGDPLVFDPGIQIEGCRHVFLWNPLNGEMEKFIADIARTCIKPLNNNVKSQIYITSYKKWLNSFGPDWLINEKIKYDSWNEQEKVRLLKEKDELYRIASLTPSERHKQLLEAKGIEYLGVRKASAKEFRRRITHCYNCKESLDNFNDLECIKCGWILCNCGACGCGY